MIGAYKRINMDYNMATDSKQVAILDYMRNIVKEDDSDCVYVAGDTTIRITSYEFGKLMALEKCLDNDVEHGGINSIIEKINRQWCSKRADDFDLMLKRKKDEWSEYGLNIVGRDCDFECGYIEGLKLYRDEIAQKVPHYDRTKTGQPVMGGVKSLPSSTSIFYSSMPSNADFKRMDLDSIEHPEVAIDTTSSINEFGYTAKPIKNSKNILIKKSAEKPKIQTKTVVVKVKKKR